MSTKLYFGEVVLQTYSLPDWQQTFTAGWGVTEKKTHKYGESSWLRHRPGNQTWCLLQVTDSNQRWRRESLAHHLLDFKDASPPQLKLNAQISLKQVKTGASPGLSPSLFLPCLSQPQESKQATTIPAAPKTGGFLPVSISSLLKRKALVSGQFKVDPSSCYGHTGPPWAGCVSSVLFEPAACINADESSLTHLSMHVGQLMEIDAASCTYKAHKMTLAQPS